MLNILHIVAITICCLLLGNPNFKACSAEGKDDLEVAKVDWPATDYIMVARLWESSI